MPGSVFGQVDHHLSQILDDYYLLQHVFVSTHIDEGIPDHFVVISTITSAISGSVYQTRETKN